MNSPIEHHHSQSCVFAEQVAYLYSHAPLVFTVNIANAAILVALELTYIPNSVLVAWFTSMVSITLARGLLAFLYYRLKPGVLETRIWYWAFFVGAGLAGATWGSSAYFLFAVNDLGRQMILIIILAGMTAAAVTVLAARMEAFLIYSIPALLPLATNLLNQDTPLSRAMSALTFIFLLGMINSAHGAHRSIATTLRLRFDNHELIEEVENRHRAEEALFQEKDRLQTTLASLAEGVIIVSADSSIEYLNPAAEHLCGWKSLDAHGKPVKTILHQLQDYKGRTTNSAVEMCLENSERCEKKILMQSRYGKEQLIEEIATPLKDRRGNISGAVTVMRDVTQAHRNSQQLVYQANHDALTHLPNRALLWDRLNHAIAKAIRSNWLIAVLFMDLDRFKTVNDSLGHSAGDGLLKLVAERLTESVREEDTVARLGGDEFIIILEHIKEPYMVSVAARKITQSFAKPFVVDGQEIFVTASIGISLYPKDGDNAESLLKNADTAMYRTKKQGRNHLEFYAEEMNAQALERLRMEQQLRYSLERGELELYYQPQVDPMTGKVKKVEALLRWHHPEYGLVLPNRFIPIAEESGAILSIGQWVLSTACTQTRIWRDLGYSGLRIAVNLSVRQIRQSNLTETVASALAESKLPPECLELEITESVFLDNVEASVAILDAIKAQGVTLGIDDFGTGFSSLIYLKQFPVDVLKIDKQFIRDVLNNPSDAAIVSAIIAMGHGLNLSVIAEGVENKAQLNFLRSRSVDGYQGFYFSRALPTSDMTELLLKSPVLQ